MNEEEVRQVADALDAVERIADPEARVRAKSRIMAEQVKRNRAWSAERSALIEELWAEGNGLSYREIAVRLDIKLSTVQDVFRTYKGSGVNRPRAPEQKPPE
ncbi:helix-turn-helix domain-containing protein [Streptomyces anulatus]|uniref:helix-turn-helix domain-containing protein n=1 Tax=Streptomyces anulatus TaxID=1892 RepID=UPI00324B7988